MGVPASNCSALAYYPSPRLAGHDIAPKLLEYSEVGRRTWHQPYASRPCSGHGTLSLYAALNTKTGQVLGQPASRHTSAEFVAFLEQIVASVPEGQQIHIIADNLSPMAPPGSGSLSIVIAKCGSILRRPVLRGLTKSRSGFPRSNATSSPAGSSVRSKTWRKNS